MLQPVNGGPSKPPVSATTLPSVPERQDEDPWGAGDGSIRHEFEYEHDHSLGWARPESRCWPEAGGSPPLIANEARLVFEVANLRTPSTSENPLWIAQDLTVRTRWRNRNGSIETVEEKWVEAFELRGRFAGPDSHWDQRVFPKWCAMDMTVVARLFVVKFRSRPVSTAFGEGFHVWRATERTEGDEGSTSGVARPIPGYEHLPVDGDFRTDPNAVRVDSHGGGYEYDQHIDHCHLVPVFDWIVANRGRIAAGRTAPVDPWEYYQAMVHVMIKTAGWPWLRSVLAAVAGPIGDTVGPAAVTAVPVTAAVSPPGTILQAGPHGALEVARGRSLPGSELDPGSGA